MDHLLIGLSAGAAAGGILVWMWAQVLGLGIEGTTTRGDNKPRSKWWVGFDGR